jgi:Zn-dependent protease
MGGAASVNDNIFYEIALWLLPLVFAIVFHEVAHGWTAYAFGDPTAKEQRRLSLNPLRHVDPIGTIALPLILAVTHAPIFGWAKPVPVRAERLRNPRVQMMLVGLAGPAMNFLLAILSALLLGLGVITSGFLQQMLVSFIAVNLFLGLFNLLPIPPFDGSHVVAGLLPERLARPYRALGRWSMLIFFTLLLILPAVFKVNIVGAIVMPPFMALLRLLGVVAGI